MLSMKHESLMHRAAKALRATRDEDNVAMADEIAEALLANASHRASVSRKASLRISSGRGGRPSTFYALEVEPGSIELHAGARAACVALEQTLRNMGSKRLAPNQTSLAVALSRKGYWHCLVDTTDGTFGVTVRKATEAEASRILLPGEELTDS